MTTNRNRTVALIGGISLLVMALTAVVGTGIIHPMMIFPDNGEATRQAISEHSVLFAVEIALWGVIFLADVLVAWALYVFFSDSARRVALAAGATRLIYSVILAAGIFVLATAAGSDTPLAQVQRFDQLWSGGLILFGFHLLLLGLAARRSRKVPKVFVWLLLIAGPAYTVVHTLPLLGTGAAEVASVLQLVMMLPMTAAEVGLAIWLVIRGGRPARKVEAGGWARTTTRLSRADAS